MKIKALFTIVFSGTLLTACGNDLDSIQNQWSGIEKLDYSKAETIEDIIQPVVDLANPDTSHLSTLTNSITTIFQYITNIENDTSSFCATGTLVVNSNNSITFDKCDASSPKDMSDLANKTGVNNLIYNPYAEIFNFKKEKYRSGTIQLLEQNTDNSTKKNYKFQKLHYYFR